MKIDSLDVFILDNLYLDYFFPITCFHCQIQARFQSKKVIHEMIKRDVKKGLATLCIGGGMGIAMCVER